MSPLPSKQRARLARKGFTLLEVLVALFIFTIIAVIMTRALHTVFENQAVTEKHAAALAELQFATLLLSRDVEQMIDRPIINREQKTEAALIGTNKTLTFTHGGFANPLGQLQQSTLQRTWYLLQQHRLIRQSWEVLDQTATSTANDRVIAGQVTALQFDYLDKENHFNDRWPPANQPKADVFPKAVKVTLTLRNWGTITQLYVIPGSSLGIPTL